jgi:hypothetical protein
MKQKAINTQKVKQKAINTQIMKQTALAGPAAAGTETQWTRHEVRWVWYAKTLERRQETIL